METSGRTRSFGLPAKCAVYIFCVLSPLIYRIGTLSANDAQITRLLTTFLRNLKGAASSNKWTDKISDTEVLYRSRCDSINTILTKHLLCWFIHVIRVSQNRLTKNCSCSVRSCRLWTPEANRLLLRFRWIVFMTIFVITEFKRTMLKNPVLRRESGEKGCLLRDKGYTRRWKHVISQSHITMIPSD